MRFFLLGLLTFSSLARAQTASGQTVPQLMDMVSTSQAMLFKSAAAAKFCKENLERWRDSSYQKNILALGEAWKTQPDPAYFVIDACQSLWVSKYFQPVRTLPSDNGDPLAKNAWWLPMLSFLRGAVYLPAEIFIFSKLRQLTNPSLPPAPYEILIGMASSERETDEVVSREMREALKIVASAGGGLAAALTNVSKVPKAAASASAAAGRITKALIIVAIASSLAGEAFDSAAWHLRHSSLIRQVESLQAKLLQPHAPVPVLVDEYFQSVRRLGYFYSYSVYMNENQQSADHPTLPETCTAALRQYFVDKSASEQTRIGSYVNTSQCPDAVVLWLQTSDFLKSAFPGDAQVELVAARLAEQAALTFRAYEEAWAFHANQWKCDYVFHPQMRLRCVEPSTGNEAI